MKTYSFSELDQKSLPEPGDKGSMLTKKDSDKSLTDCSKPTPSQPPSLQPSLRTAPLTNQNVANPFLEPETADKDPGQTATRSVDSALPRIVDKPPDYISNRKQYVGSPNLRLRKRPNPLARFLPKAFSVDISAYSPTAQVKASASGEISEHERSSAFRVTEPPVIELTEKSMRGKKEKKKELRVVPEKVEDKGRNELVIAAGEQREQKEGVARCCVRDPEAGKCVCVIM